MIVETSDHSAFITENPGESLIVTNAPIPPYVFGNATGKNFSVDHIKMWVLQIVMLLLNFGWKEEGYRELLRLFI
jgi:hypothetical protein